MRKMRIHQLFTIAVLVAAASVAHAQTFSVLYDFGTNRLDPTGLRLLDIVAQGRDGSLYSTSSNGGTQGVGTVFKITPEGTLTVLYDFQSDGSSPDAPYSGLTLGTDGNFYGTTTAGGTSGLGTVFKVTPSGTVTVLHSFGGSDGNFPYAPPIQGADGNFYGTTYFGGNSYVGAVYKITPSGKLTTLYSFDGVHGKNPVAPLVQGRDGNFYGTAENGGSGTECIYGCGTLYKITPSGKLKVIHNFHRAFGGQPLSPLVQGSDGNFYGTTSRGGTKNKDNGVIFKVTADGKFTVLHNVNGTTDGAGPVPGLVQATDGNFYGTTGGGGTRQFGTIFKISPTKPYPYTVLYNFDLTTGAGPEVTLLQHTNGTLYGDTSAGGTGHSNQCNSCGTFYSLDIGVKPFVSLVSTAGEVGKTIEILGQGFKGTTGVSFNGTPTTFKVVSSTYLTAVVPAGATTGFVTVTTPKGQLTSNKKFRVN
jgi:uncharacterized repeat protein (TIGR03803 family)